MSDIEKIVRDQAVAAKAAARRLAVTASPVKDAALRAMADALEKNAAVILAANDEDMAAAREKADRAGIRNISFRQGDIGDLPFADDSFDIVLSLNGFHAFLDKEAAYRETFRVLKPGGTICGCFYIEGGCRRTDWFIRHLYVKKGFFIS